MKKEMATKFILVSLLLLQLSVTAFSAGKPNVGPKKPNPAAKLKGNKGKPRPAGYEPGGPAGGIPKPGSTPQVAFGGVDHGDNRPKVAKAPDPTGKKWCIAKNNLKKTVLKKDFEDICKEPGIDCAPTSGTGLCYTESHWSKVSFALNAKFVKTKICDQGGRAELTNIDPSWGKCIMPGIVP